MKKSINYRTYRLTKKELLIYSLQAAGITSFFGYIFYQSLIGVLILLPGSILLVKKKQTELIIKRQEKLLEEFKEAMISVKGGLCAGYSIENAFIETRKDMNYLYGEQSYIVQEFIYMEQKMNTNQTLEGCMFDLAKRTDSVEIQDFADVFVIAKRNSGNVVSIIQRTVGIIVDRIEMRREIQTLVSSKQFEQKIMNVIPLGIIFYLKEVNPGFMNVLYHNLIGVIIMSICLVLYIAAIMLSEKIVKIDCG